MLPNIFAGQIVQWHGSIVSIPTGWALCDGNNGTPDLRDKFVVGSGDTYSPGDTGGAVNNNHTFTGDTHEHFTQAAPVMLSGTPVSSAGTFDAVTGTTDNTNDLPTFYSLAFIMKL